MASNLRVDNIQPTTGTGIGIGTANGSVTFNADVTGGMNIATGGMNIATGSLGVGINNPTESKVVIGHTQTSTVKHLAIKDLTNNWVRKLGVDSSNNFGIFDGDTEQLRITSAGNFQINNGNLVFSTSGKGIDFSATTDATGMTSELLDDYEEGSFVPIARGRTTAGTTSYARTAVGKYVKIGRLVNVMVDMVFGSATGTGNLEIAGLPFAAHSGPYVRFAGSVTLLNAGISWSNQIAPYINDTLSHFWITNTPTSGNYSFVDINSSTTEILLNCTYMVD